MHFNAYTISLVPKAGLLKLLDKLVNSLSKISVNNKIQGGREIAHWIESLPCTQDDPSLIPDNPHDP